MSLLRVNLLKGTFGGGSTPQWKGSTFQIVTGSQQLYGVGAFQTGVQASVPWQLWSCTNSTTVGTMITSGSATPDGRYGWYTSDLSSAPINLPQGYYLLVFQQGSGYVIGNALTDGIAQTDINSQFNGYDGASAPTTGQTISGNVGPYNHEIAIGTNGVEQTLAPNSLPTETSLTGAVTAIQDDPQSPDANWLTASANNSDVTIQAAFPVPSAGNSGIVGSQNFEVLVRRNASGTTSANPTAQLAVRISGSTTNIITGHTLSLADDNTHIMTLAFDPANYASSGVNADGSNLQIYVSGTHAGTTASKSRSMDIGAVRYYAQGAQAGPKSYTQTLTDSITVNDPSNIARIENLHITLVESSLTVGDNTVSSMVGHNTLVTLSADSLTVADSNPLTLLYGKANFRTLSDSVAVGDTQTEYMSKSGSSSGGIVQTGLIAYYNSQQGVVGSTWQNLAPTGSRYDMTLVGPPTVTPSGMQFTSSGAQYAYTNMFTELASGSATIEFRSNINNTASEPDYYSTGNDTGSTTPTYNVYPNGTALVVEPGGTSVIVNNAVTDSVEEYLTIVLDTSMQTLTVYKNGVALPIQSNVTSTTILNGASNSYFYLTDAYYPINGIIDNFKVYNRALSATEVTQNYSNGSAVGLANASASYTVNLNDSVNVGDSNVTAQYAHGGPSQTLSDPVTVGDNPVTKQVARHITLPVDSIGVADTSVAKQSTFHKTLSADSITTADTTVTKQSTLFRTLSVDSITSADNTITKQVSLHKTLTADSVTVGDTTATKQTSLHRTLSVDSITSADNTIVKQASLYRTLTADYVTVGDTTSTKQASLFRTLSVDSITSADTSVNKLATLYRTLTADSITSADTNVTKQSTMFRTLSVDSITSSDTSVNKLATLHRTLTADSVSVADTSATKQSSFKVTLNTDSVGVADTVVADTEAINHSVTLPADSISFVDNPVVKQATLHKTLTVDSISPIDTAATTLSNLHRTLTADSVGVADTSVSKQLSVQRTLNTDSVGVADTNVSTSHTLLRSVVLPVDSVGISDNSISKQSALHMVMNVDSVGLSDTNLSKQSTLHLTMGADSVGVSDTSITKQAVLHRTLSVDSVMVADSTISTGATNHITLTLPVDSISFVDSSITKQSSLHQTLTVDSISPADNTVTKLSNLHRTLSVDSVVVADSPVSVGSTNHNSLTLPVDSIGITDVTVTKQFALYRTNVDSIGFTESVTKKSTLYRTLSADSIAVKDGSEGGAGSLVVGATHDYAVTLPVDSITINEFSLNKQATLHRTFTTDSIGFADSVSYDGIAHHSLTISDSIYFTEVVNTLEHVSRSLTDSIGVIDSVSKKATINKTLSADSIGITDNVTSSQSHFYSVNLTDSIGSVDYSATKQSDFNRSLTDSVGNTDNITQKSAIHVTLNDTVITADTVWSGHTLHHNATIIDSIGFEDDVLVEGAFFHTALLKDTLPIIDNIGRTMNLHLSLSDYQGVDDSLTYSEGHLMTLADILAISDDDVIVGAEIHPLANVYLTLNRSVDLYTNLRRDDSTAVNLKRSVNVAVSGSSSSSTVLNLARSQNINLRIKGGT